MGARLNAQQSEQDLRTFSCRCIHDRANKSPATSCAQTCIFWRRRDLLLTAMDSAETASETAANDSYTSCRSASFFAPAPDRRGQPCRIIFASHNRKSRLQCASDVHTPPATYFLMERPTSYAGPLREVALEARSVRRLQIRHGAAVTDNGGRNPQRPNGTA